MGERGVRVSIPAGEGMHTVSGSLRRAGMRTGMVVGAAALLLGSSSARADEPRSSTEPRLMMEPGEVTNVIDAFDDLDPFDANISLGFEYSSKSAKILRETSIYEPGLTTGGYTAHTMSVAEYSETT